MDKKISGKGKAETALHLLICFIIGIYPLLLFELDFGSFYIQSLVLFTAVMGVLLYSFLLIRSGAWRLKLFQSRLDVVVLALTAYAVLKIIIKMIRMTETKIERFDPEIMILTMAVLYLLITVKPMFTERYLDILLFSGLIVFALLLVKYLCVGETGGVLSALIQDKTQVTSCGVASYAMLVCMAGLWRYVKCEDRLRSFFYAGVLSVGFLVMFINQNIVSIWMMIIVFIVFPVLQRPTAELVKRDMQIFFLYLFMLCNMSLLTNYTDLLQVTVNYDLKQSVYLELLVAVGGIFFFKFWDRIPKGVDTKRLVMRKMRRSYQFLLKLMCIIFAGILLGGEYWKELPDEGSLTAVKGFAVPLVEEVWQNKNAFYMCFEQFGVIGSLMLLILCVLLIGKLKKGYGFDKPVTSMLILISSVFLIQLLFWGISINTLPIYWIFLSLAITYREEKVRVISNIIKFE
ncbi:MAG: hypothetical protein Q4D94_14505 [Bacillota bacterium]|nr:hypothetical protein [Bacillota bacterium]